MYDANSIKKQMELVCKKQKTDVQILFAPLMIAKFILTTKTKQAEYDEWVDSLTELVRITDDKGRQVIYRVLAILHFKYKHAIEKAGRYAPLELILKIGLTKGAYYYHFEHPDMRKQVFADYGVSDTEAFSLIRKKMDTLESIMVNGILDRDRIAASKELTKYVDHLILPGKKGNFFSTNMLVDNSRDKQITNNQVDFNALPGMDNEDVRKELAGHATTITINEDGEVEEDDE